MFLRLFGTHLSLVPQKLLLPHQEQNQCLENKLDAYIPQRSRAARTAAGARARPAAPSSGWIHRLCLPAWRLPRVARSGADPRGSRRCAAPRGSPRGAASRGSPRGAAPRGVRAPRTHCAPARRCVPPAWRAARGARPSGERRSGAAAAVGNAGGGHLGFVDREGSGRGISTETNGRWPARPGYELGILLKGGTMDISPAEAHLSELLYRYLLTEHG